jgi:BT1 family
MFSSHFYLTPQAATLLLALICLPEGLSFFFGLFSDTVTIFGS